MLILDVNFGNNCECQKFTLSMSILTIIDHEHFRLKAWNFWKRQETERRLGHGSEQGMQNYTLNGGFDPTLCEVTTKSPKSA